MKRILYYILGLLFFSSCAKVVMPVGGPKDTTPPVMMKVVPANQSVNFRSKQIKITFNEYVVLNNPTENLIISPPMKNLPVCTTSGKSIIIMFKDTLKANTTYNLLFSDCIKDYTEGNPMNLFHYSLATGPTIDSCEAFGTVVDAVTLKPVDNIFVFLYETDVDSLPFTVLPTYLTKTQKDGSFHFLNIRKGQYKIFALKDVNNNLIFDMPNEGIAYCDSMIVSEMISNDSNYVTNDSVPKLVLSYFQEEDTTQFLYKMMNPQKGIYIFPYKTAFASFTEIPTSDSFPSYFKVVNSTSDTVIFYMKEEVTDSVNFIFLTDNRKDTIALVPYKNSSRSGRGKKQENNMLRITTSNMGDLYRIPKLHFSYPIKPIDSVEVYCVKKNKSGNDTTRLWLSVPDSFVMELSLPFSFEELANYSVFMRDSLFFGYDGSTHDTLIYNFSIKSSKEYGNLRMNYICPKENTQYIVSLVNSSGSRVYRHIINNSQMIDYRYLTPGNYNIEVVEDLNKNGKWDTGNYRKKRQPERVFFFGKDIMIRGFWEVEEDFTL